MAKYRYKTFIVNKFKQLIIGIGLSLPIAFLFYGYAGSYNHRLPLTPLQVGVGIIIVCGFISIMIGKGFLKQLKNALLEIIGNIFFNISF